MHYLLSGRRLAGHDSDIRHCSRHLEWPILARVGTLIHALCKDLPLLLLSIEVCWLALAEEREPACGLCAMGIERGAWKAAAYKLP